MKLHIMQVIDFLASFVTSWLNSSHRCIKRTILDMFYLTACGLLHKQHADLYSNIFMTWIISRKVSSTLTWLIFEVEDGHDVVSEIKHRKHSHFGESLGNIAQIKNCQHVHVAGLSCVSVLFRLRSLEDPPKPGPQTVRHSKPLPPLPHPPTVSTVKDCDTQALLLISLISTASASMSSSSALSASCSAFFGRFSWKTKGSLCCLHRDRRSAEP